ncbi:MAG: helix-turn-helix domain-containing protein [bacterium]|nr:helix-turn-helix domain-containing protein [bacterium]
MSVSSEIKKIRQSSFLSQEAFAREIHVSFSSVNRWEGGRSKPNMIAMKNLKDFCEAHNMDFSKIQEEWLQAEKEG